MKTLIFLLVGTMFVVPIMVDTPLHAQFRCLNGRDLDPDYESQQQNCDPDPYTLSEYEGPDCKVRSDEEEYVIPIVVHVMHEDPNGPENVTDDQIITAVTLLNEQFTNPSTPFSQSIRFEFAKFDPDGNCTNGINHVLLNDAVIVGDAKLGGTEDLNFKSQSLWDLNNYLNIWLVKDIINPCEGGIVGGYSSWPFTTPDGWTATDGVLLRYDFLTSGDRGVLVHEIGHYLGLHHCWGPDPENACVVSKLECSVNDGVPDTNPCKGWPDDQTCSGFTYPIENFMVYGSGRTTFTQGQMDRMAYWLHDARSNLYSAQNLMNTLGGASSITSYSGTSTVTGTAFQGDVIILTGADITFTGNFTVPPGRKITVEKGAKLTLSGATISVDASGVCASGEPAMWYGIEVQGLSSRSQTSNYTAQFQGVLVVQNSTLEHAIKAVKLYGPTRNDGGGQLLALNSNILNCQTGVDIESYRDGNANYQAKLSNVSFLIDDDYQGYNTPSAGIDMHDVIGVRIKNCSFINSNTEFSHVGQYGRAINAKSAGFKVFPQIKNGEMLGCHFEGWYQAISASSVMRNQYLEITHSSFKRNQFGIVCQMVNNSTIIYNDFDMGELPDNAPLGDQFGIFLQGPIAGMDIENNTFVCNPVTGGQCQQPTIITTGIMSVGLGAFDNIIQLNTFEGIEHGNVSNLENRGFEFPFAGLLYLCNSNTNLRGYDFSICDTEHPDVIKRIQRFNGLPAGNTFSVDHVLDANHFRNEESTEIVQYHYFDQGLNEKPTDVLSVVLDDDQSLASCITNLEDFPGPVVDVHEPDRANLNGFKGSFQSHSDTLALWIDSLNLAIANNDQPAIDSFTLKSSDKHTTVDQLNQDILQLISTDTASFDFIDYMNWIDQVDSYESDLWQVREYVARGDMTNAHAVFDNIATKHTLDSLRQIDVSNAGVILDMLDSMHYTSLYPQQLDTLVAIEAAAPGVASSWANGILGMYNMNAPLEYVLCSSIPLQPTTATGEREWKMSYCMYTPYRHSRKSPSSCRTQRQQGSWSCSCFSPTALSFSKGR